MLQANGTDLAKNYVHYEYCFLIEQVESTDFKDRRVYSRN